MKSIEERVKPIYFKVRSHFDLFYLLLLVLLGLIHLHFALRTDAYFSQDDFAVLGFLKTHDMLSMIRQFLARGDMFGFRKVLGYVNLKFLFIFFKTNPFPYLLNNHFIHTFNLILLFLIVRHLTKKSFAAFWVSLIFNKFYLFYFSNVHEYLACFFCLLTTYLFFKFPKRPYLSLVAFLLALLSKEATFTLPFLLLALTYIQKTSKKRLVPFFLLLFLYLLYQLRFFLSGSTLPPNESYLVSFRPGVIRYNLLFYFKPAILLLFIIPPFLTKKLKSFSVLLIAILTLAPVLFFVNRREIYYLYLPMSYFLIYLSLHLPKFSLKTVPVFVLIFLIFGGRQVLPLIAKQHFPNWQKVSLENVTSYVKESLKQNPESIEINVSHIHLERDARAMLEYSVIDLFLPKSLSEQYLFSYNPRSETITATKKK